MVHRQDYYQMLYHRYFQQSEHCQNVSFGFFYMYLNVIICYYSVFNCILSKIFNSENATIEYLEEDAALFEKPQLLASNQVSDKILQNPSNDECKENVHDWSQFAHLDEIGHTGHTHDTIVRSQSELLACNKCVQLQFELEKSKILVSKLQKRCAVKTAEIKRLRVSEKRSKLAKKTLEDVLREIKEKKWISAEGQDVLNVISNL